MVRDYVLSVAKQYDPHAYKILKSDTTFNFVKYFKVTTKKEMAEELNTAVHEAIYRN